MEITITNIDDFKPYLGKSNGADAGYEYIKKFGKLYSKSDTIKKTIDQSLLLINKIVSENEPKKKPLKHKYTKGKGKRKVVGRRKKGEKKSEPKKPKKKAKTSGTTKKTTTKTEKQTKTKKQPKKKVGEAAPWQATLRRFATMCGKERTVTSVRKFVKEIQVNFSAKLRKKTPHIELIREIQEKLLPYANKTNVVKVQIPAWADLKTQCQAAAKEWTVSKTVEKPEIKETALSGLKKK
jgi:hypothetical protein